MQPTTRIGRGRSSPTISGQRRRSRPSRPAIAFPDRSGSLPRNAIDRVFLRQARTPPTHRPALRENAPRLHGLRSPRSCHDPAEMNEDGPWRISSGSAGSGSHHRHRAVARGCRSYVRTGRLGPAGGASWSSSSSRRRCPIAPLPPQATSNRGLPHPTPAFLHPARAFGHRIQRHDHPPHDRHRRLAGWTSAAYVLGYVPSLTFMVRTCRTRLLPPLDHPPVLAQPAVLRHRRRPDWQCSTAPACPVPAAPPTGSMPEPCRSRTRVRSSLSSATRVGRPARIGRWLVQLGQSGLQEDDHLVSAPGSPGFPGAPAAAGAPRSRHSAAGGGSGSRPARHGTARPGTDGVGWERAWACPEDGRDGRAETAGDDDAVQSNAFSDHAWHVHDRPFQDQDRMNTLATLEQVGHRHRTRRTPAAPTSILPSGTVRGSTRSRCRGRRPSVRLRYGPERSHERHRQRPPNARYQPATTPDRSCDSRSLPWPATSGPLPFTRSAGQ